MRTHASTAAAACSYCGFCAPIGCHSGAKGSIDVTAIPLAEATKNLKVVPQAHVTAITSDDDGLATGVLYFKGGRQFWQPAGVVILSAFTYENVRLLLLSKTRAYRTASQTTMASSGSTTPRIRVQRLGRGFLGENGTSSSVKGHRGSRSKSSATAISITRAGGSSVAATWTAASSGSNRDGE